MVTAAIGTRICGYTAVNANGDWSMTIGAKAPCNPYAGAEVTFLVDQAPQRSTPAAIWMPDGRPADLVQGYALEPR